MSVYSASSVLVSTYVTFPGKSLQTGHIYFNTRQILSPVKEHDSALMSALCSLACQIKLSCLLGERPRQEERTHEDRSLWGQFKRQRIRNRAQVKWTHE